MDGFGQTAVRLEEAVEAASAATLFLQQSMAEGRQEEALAGATPYLRLISLAAGGAHLARGGLCGGDEQRITLSRFFAENLLGETRALADRVLTGAASLAAAGRLLV
jgi:acyl-CoA dehydrogenase